MDKRWFIVSRSEFFSFDLLFFQLVDKQKFYMDKHWRTMENLLMFPIVDSWYFCTNLTSLHKSSRNFFLNVTCAWCKLLFWKHHINLDRLVTDDITTLSRWIISWFFRVKQVHGPVAHFFQTMFHSSSSGFPFSISRFTTVLASIKDIIAYR